MNRPLIGCFAAASNVTGILVDTERIAYLMHKYDGLVFFDYATAGNSWIISDTFLVVAILQWNSCILKSDNSYNSNSYIKDFLNP